MASSKTSSLIRRMLQRKPTLQRSRHEQETQTSSSTVFPTAGVLCCHQSNSMAKSDDYSTEKNTNTDIMAKSTSLGRRFSSSSFKSPRRSLTSLIIKFKSKDSEDENSADQKKPLDVTILNKEDPCVMT